MLTGVVVLTVAAPIAVWADPARPTNYRSEVTSVEPASPEVSARVAGGDAFLVLSVASTAEVVVLGYGREPYLWFDSSGTVRVNTRSPAHYLNQDRYGQTALPGTVSVDAPPDWEVVAEGGEYGWHDHRIHRMAPQPPPGVSRDQVTRILLWEVPIEVDGRPAVITGHLDWLPAVTPFPWLVLSVLAFALLELIRRRRSVGGFLALGVGGLAAVVVGVAQARSSPYGAMGELMAWGPAAFALVVALFGLYPRAHRFGIMPGVASVVLATWAALRFSGFWMPVLPTDLLTGMERGALAVAVGAAGSALFAVFAGVVAAARPSRATTALLVLALFWSWPSAAVAHTEPDLVAVPAGSSATVTLRPAHGCGDSPTIEVAVRAPVGDAIPEPVASWDVSAEADGEGNTVLTWSGGVLPADRVGEFPLTFTVPDAVGELLLFPSIQTCENGEELAWISGDPESEFPAPRLLVLPEDHPPAASIEQVAPDAPGRHLLVEVVDTDRPTTTTVPATTTTEQATTTTALATTTTTIEGLAGEEEAGAPGFWTWVGLIAVVVALSGFGLMRRLGSQRR